MKILTVGELKKALKGVPDDLEVRLTSDTGLDQPRFKGNEIILESASEIHFGIPNDLVFDDGGNEIHYFQIYGNEVNINEIN